MTITAKFSVVASTLTESGDDLDNTIVTSRDAAGHLSVNGGAVAIKGPRPTVANTSLIQVSGGAGNDVITLDERNGALPAASLNGGSGDDVLTGGSGADQLLGQSGNDRLNGGNGNDVLAGGLGSDQIFGEAGNDRMVWNPGDGADMMEGGDGTDVAEVNAGNGAEVFTITANGTRVRLERTEPAPVALDIGTTEHLELHANGGDDVIGAAGNLSALIQLTIDGGAGNDHILAGNGADLLHGGDGDDFVDGQQGNDTAFLGVGNDMFQWDPGDGSDFVEGQDGIDTLVFNGSNVGETVALSASGGRVRLARDIGAVAMDLNGVERIDVNALGGADTFTVGDLTGTGVTEVAIRLVGTLGGTAGDAAADTVIVQGTQAGDVVGVTGSAGAVTVAGLSAQVTVSGIEGAGDTLMVAGEGGSDTINASTVMAGTVRLTLDGGAGSDTLIGSPGADVMVGGDGDDLVDGRQGSDAAFLGAGNDAFQWNPGDGNDVVEGQDGYDTLRFSGSNVSESISVSANGGRTLLYRNVAGVAVDLDDVERLEYRAWGGVDQIAVGNLAGTDVTQVAIDLAGPLGGADGESDRVVLDGTQSGDVIRAQGSSDGISVVGPVAQTTLSHVEAVDLLTLNGLGGDDVMDASGLRPGAIGLQMHGGPGADVLFGTEGGDLASGGDGNDLALLGAGNDIFAWNPGDDNDTVEGQAGYDVLQFSGANVSEAFTVSADAERVRLERNVAVVTMDLDDIECIDYRALGGADTIVVNDLAGTDVTQVNIDLAAATGAGDGEADTVAINGSAGTGVIAVKMEGTTLYVNGLSAQLVISNFESSLDRLLINDLAVGGLDALGGDVAIEAFAGSVSGDLVL